MTTDRMGLDGSDSGPVDLGRVDLDWLDLTRREGVASHRLVGWIYWDPVAIENYAALGPDPFTYYIATRGHRLRWPATKR